MLSHSNRAKTGSEAIEGLDSVGREEGCRGAAVERFALYQRSWPTRSVQRHSLMMQLWGRYAAFPVLRELARKSAGISLCGGTDHLRPRKSFIWSGAEAQRSEHVTIRAV